MAPPIPPSSNDHTQKRLNQQPAVTYADPNLSPPPLLSPKRSRFASEDRIGEAQFYPGGSPTPRMSRNSEEYHQRQYYHSQPTYYDEPEPYEDTEPAPIAAQPVKKKNRWKRILSRMKGKRKGSAHAELPPSPPSRVRSTHTGSVLEPPVMPATMAGSDISAARRYELSDPGFVQHHRVSATESRDESLRLSQQAKRGPAQSRHSGSVLDPGPPVMLVDAQTGNQIPREPSYISQTGSHQLTADGVPIKRKRTVGGTLKRLFSRKKKPPPLVLQPPAEPAPPPRFVEVDEDHPLPPAPVHTTPPSVAPPVMSPRSSGSHRSAFSPQSEVVVIPSTRAPSVDVPVQRGPASVTSSRRSAPAYRRNTPSPIGATAIPVRRTTNSSVGTGSVRAPASFVGTGAPPVRRGTGSSRGVTTSSIGAAAPTTRPTRAPAAPLSKVTGSESPSIHSAQGERDWGEVHVPPEPAPPIRTTRPSAGFARTAIPRPRVAARTPRTYPAMPPPRKPYVHVPRPIPPPPRYPTLPTRTAAASAGTGTGTEAQVQLVVAALRDLAEEHRHDRAVAEARLADEREWAAAERERDAELRALVMQLAQSRVGEFGERVVLEETSRAAAPGGLGTTGLGTTGLGTARLGTTGLGTARFAGLGVGGSDIERLLEIMQQGHEVTMATYRDLIQRWRADIETNHQKFLAEQDRIRARRHRKREKPIRWQPGVNMW